MKNKIKTKTKKSTKKTVKTVKVVEVNHLKEELARYDFHKIVKNQKDRMEELRASGKVIVKKIFKSVPECADRTAALRDLRKCIMQCNLAIANEK